MSGDLAFAVLDTVVQWSFQAADPSDQDKIHAFFKQVGFDKAKEFYYSSDAMQSQFDDIGVDFPDSEGDVRKWLDDMSPAQGRQIVSTFEKNYAA